MEYFMFLQRGTVEELRRDLKEAEAGKQEGIDIYTFVRTLLKYWPTDNLEGFIANLIALFEIIDVDGSGQVSWEEFLDFCVEAGDWSTQARCAPWHYTYRQAADFRDTVSCYHDLQVLTFLPEISYVCLVEAGAKEVKVLQRGCKPVFELHPQEEFNREEVRKKKLQRRGRLQAQDPAKIVQYLPDPAVLAIEYIPIQRQLVMSTLDRHLSYWDVDTMHNRIEYTEKVLSETALYGIYYSRYIGLLFGWGHDKGNTDLHAWDVRTKALRFRCEGHSGTVTCAVEIAKWATLASAGMDGQIIFWDLRETRKTLTVDHAVVPPILAVCGPKPLRGFRALAYSVEHDILLCVGYDMTGFGYDPNSYLLQLKLVGHRSPLLDVKVVKHETERALTCDIDGSFRIWAIERSVGSRAVCIGLFDASTPMSTIKPKAIVVAWDLSIITSANGLSMLESVPLHRKEAPLSVRFSEDRGEFFVQMIKTAALIDAATGKAKRHFNFVVMGDATVCAIDATGAKVVTGDASGNVRVHRTLNLNRIADAMKGGHKAEVSGLVLDESSNLIITVSSDRAVHVYDGVLGPSGFTKEGLKLHDLTLLRSCDDAHEREINALAFSHRLSLIATASLDRTIRLWDYQRLALENIVTDISHEITALEFLGPYPVLIAADASGRVRGWFTRPQVNVGTRPAFSFYNVWVPEDPADDDDAKHSTTGRDNQDYGEGEGVNFPVTCMQLNELADGRLEVFMGDEYGVIKRWDFTRAIAKLACQPVDLPASLEGAYNPRQTAFRTSAFDGMNASKQARITSLLEEQERQTSLAGGRGSLVSQCSSVSSPKSSVSSTPSRSVKERRQASSPPDISADMLEMETTACIFTVAAWTAHSGTITCLQCLKNPQAIVTGSMDKSVKVWSWSGEPLGVVLAQSINQRVDWTFKYDTEPARNKIKAEVARVLDGLDRVALAVSLPPSTRRRVDQDSCDGSDDDGVLSIGTKHPPHANDPVMFANKQLQLVELQSVPESEGWLHVLLELVMQRMQARHGSGASMGRGTKTVADRYRYLIKERRAQEAREMTGQMREGQLIDQYALQHRRSIDLLSLASFRRLQKLTSDTQPVQRVVSTADIAKPVKSTWLSNRDQVREATLRVDYTQRQREEIRMKRDSHLEYLSRIASQVEEVCKSTPTWDGKFRPMSAKISRCQAVVEAAHGPLDEDELGEGEPPCKRTRSRREKRPTRQKNKNLVALHKITQMEKMSAETLDQKKTGRFGPYSIRDLLDFIVFANYFDKSRTGYLSSASLAKSLGSGADKKRFGPLLEVLGCKVVPEEQPEESPEIHAAAAAAPQTHLIALDDVLRKMFRYARREEIRRMRNFTELVHLTETLAADALRNKRVALTPPMEHEITSLVLTQENWGCGTATTREVAEAIAHCLPPGSGAPGVSELDNGMQAALALTDLSKELDAREVVGAFNYVLRRLRPVTPGTLRSNPMSPGGQSRVIVSS